MSGDQILRIYVWGFWESPNGSTPLTWGMDYRNPLTAMDKNAFTPDELIDLILKIKQMQADCLKYVKEANL